MILQSLVSYYEALAGKGKVAAPGWCQAKVSYAIDLAPDGTLRGIVPLKTEVERGKKKVFAPQNMRVPEMVSRSSGVFANFLCDNAKYILGVDGEGCATRTMECFQSAKKLHLKVLESAKGELAEAVRNFFTMWDSKTAGENPEIQPLIDDLNAGANLVFCMGARYAQDDGEIKEAWTNYRGVKSGDAEGVCLVTGQRTQIARTHTGIKGVMGAQSSGAALVSFNEQSFLSYGKEQSFNAPVGKYAMFAYTTALNYLLSQREYVYLLGDATVVFWAEDGDEHYQEMLHSMFEAEDDNQETIKGVFDALAKGRPVCVEDVELNPNQKCHILGLAPNAARLAVRFFLQDSFGSILENLGKHYKRMEIKKPPYEQREYLGIYRMLKETVNLNSKDKSPLPGMAAGVMRAVLTDGKYPESLYGNTLMRIRAENGEVTRGRAGIIKAYLVKNKNCFEKEDDFVALNEETNDVAYVLGRLFAVLGEIQERANPGINTNIRDRYFNSASATPEAVFPILMRLANSHIRKLDEGSRIHYERMLANLSGRLNAFPKRLNLEEQGRFILGYYHQTQRRYAKKEDR